MTPLYLLFINLLPDLGLDLPLRSAWTATIRTLTAAGGLPRPSPTGARPTSDRIQGRVNLARVLAQDTICLSLLLGSTKALEMLPDGKVSSRIWMGQGRRVET